MSPGSCSRCNRPLAVDSDGGLCPECLRTAGSAGPTPASAARHPHTPATPPAPGGPATLSAGPPAAAPAGHPFAAQFQTTFTDTDRTRTPHPDGDTGGFEAATREYLPEAPPGYDLVRPLGAGGWSTVYLAREHAAEGTVAIKFLHAPTSPIAFERFLVEARALRQLDHPNIVRVFAVETHWREPFLTMEYAAGGTLADLARPGGPLPDPADAARLMVPVAEAVAAAHAAGILHRDLKPSNVLLASGERGAGSAEPKTEHDECPGASDSALRAPRSALVPKVSDFGLAKRTDRDDGLTRTGPLGTPSYMSPEAAAGRFREVGPAADVYGLGATLYHLLTGRPPFTGDDSTEVIRKVLTDPPDRPRAVRPDIPAELEAIVVKALEKDPAARYATPADMAADLRRFLAGQVPAAPVLSRGRRMRRWVGRNRKRIGATVGVVLLAVGLVAAGRSFKSGPPLPPPDPEEAIRAELAAGKSVRLLGADGRPRVAGWPLGGAELTATADDGGTCSFRSQPARVLLLLTDPGIDRYRVRAEIRQDTDAGAGNPPGGNAVGLVFGYAWQNGANGSLIHTMLRLGFNEVAPVRKLALAQVGVAEYPRVPNGGDNPDPRMPRGESQVPIASVPLPAAGAGERPWRSVAAEVAPVGVRTPGRAGVYLTDLKELDDRRAALRVELARDKAGFTGPLPPWSPRMPVGIWCGGTGVAVRNVVIEPLD